jgi:hypothetical protein
MLAAAMVMGFVATASAKDKWEEVATVTVTEKGAHEASVGKAASDVRIACTDGAVVINTVVVRKGAEKDPHTVAKRLNKNEEITIGIGDKVNVTGLRISHDGRGTYKVAVK